MTKQTQILGKSEMMPHRRDRRERWVYCVCLRNDQGRYTWGLMYHSVSCPNLYGPFNPMKNEKCVVTLLEVGNVARENGTGARFAGLLHNRCKR